MMKFNLLLRSYVLNSKRGPSALMSFLKTQTDRTLLRSDMRIILHFYVKRFELCHMLC